MSEILMLNGPNLNLLGKREPDLYGKLSLSEIELHAIQQAKDNGYSLHCFQSNSESELVEQIHQTLTDDTRIILFNPAAFTHSSISIRDALLAVNKPCIEIHLSNPKAREAFRHASFISDICLGTISGFGAMSYTLAVSAAIDWLLKINPVHHTEK
ncbi:MAG: type II 3-dehydroquinate dehydratase [Gammaproteobacteria bacterium CG22_combo_CG10-13_8_21_14_all_40_8]|nr:MAG: type II 3-dehydroquinate dehydratase [Gammaproteobacteria bacterium CG22_combo_CG10-13_8_21_14_all_40_8]